MVEHGAAHLSCGVQPLVRQRRHWAARKTTLDLPTFKCHGVGKGGKGGGGYSAGASLPGLSIASVANSTDVSKHSLTPATILVHPATHANAGIPGGPSGTGWPGLRGGFLFLSLFLSGTSPEDLKKKLNLSHAGGGGRGVLQGPN